MSTIHPARISKVLPDSIAAEIGFEAGDAIVAINGTRPRDLIDYQYLCADEVLELEVLDAAGKTHHLEIEKDYDDDLGLEFESALFDGLIQCNNHCPFCFIDQQPPGKRSSLYFKDDDYRLSFLYGSYLTLTNLPEKEWQRIEQMRLSPLYVSVHATEPEIRTRLLKNPRAGQILSQLKWFQARRLQIHAQVVVCPGINDGIHLEHTIRDLASFYTGEVPTIASVAVVPVGLTKFRPQEDELIPVTPAKAQEVISQVRSLSVDLRQKFGSSVVWLADEWFLIAGEELPSEEEYEEYPQIDNGVGSIRLFIKQFTAAAQSLPSEISPNKKLTWVVGNAVEKAFQPLLQQLNAVRGLQVNMRALASDYWGQQISVTGLLTGHDLLLNLQDQDLGDGILLPSVMLKHGESLFLDDMSIAEVASKLGTKIFPVAGIAELLDTCIA
ncbi:TIGR03279 family radical SAM protein [Calothrix sp. FACHB-1219]|uniref:TIGR03279 family radical SAM protein n=1 Tax=unclassified Calothrix TaxID=2619626 RepID=UPI0016860F85|nr:MULTISPECIES: TIGR03279 family radical SAM protein [unclassified Calothrix]MBD2204681.1 TIGR03279 family radical SAM protein [Calothrix sp. FACHB-168]MBD2216807.1 TIGR03279 family radical SAM protein [Calothrix sp. FACHB-1219]